MTFTSNRTKRLDGGFAHVPVGIFNKGNQEIGAFGSKLLPDESTAGHTTSRSAGLRKGFQECGVFANSQDCGGLKEIVSEWQIIWFEPLERTTHRGGGLTKSKPPAIESRPFRRPGIL